MRGVNKVIIVGNLGADPESKQFSNGGSVTNISVANSKPDARIKIMKLVDDYEHIVELELTDVLF